MVVINGLCFKSHSSNVMSLQTPSVVDVIVVGGVIVVDGVTVVVIPLVVVLNWNGVVLVGTVAVIVVIVVGPLVVELNLKLTC